MIRKFDVENMQKLHHEQSFTLDEIADLYGVTAPTISYHFHKHKIAVVRRNYNSAAARQARIERELNPPEIKR